MKINENTFIRLIQVYAPIKDAPEKEIDEFYERLDKVIENDKEYYTIVMGDFNAIIGNESTKQKAQNTPG